MRVDFETKKLTIEEADCQSIRNQVAAGTPYGQAFWNRAMAQIGSVDDGVHMLKAVRTLAHLFGVQAGAKKVKRSPRRKQKEVPVSDCCGAPMQENSDRCSRCGEHADVYHAEEAL